MKKSEQTSRGRIRPCPLCSTKKSTTLYTQKFSGGLTHVIVTCDMCGFVYVHNSPSQTFYNRYYQRMSKYEIERAHGLHHDYVKIIKQFVPKTAKILDIGSSTGHVLSLLKNAGYSSLLGIDPSPTCREIGKEKFGVKIETTDLDHFTTKTKFDCILLTAVLEHVDNPRKVIATISQLLADGGFLFIVVPDAGRFHTQFDEPYGEFSTEHISFFSESYLYQFLRSYSNVYMKSDTLCIYSLWKKESDVTVAIKQYIEKSEQKLTHVHQTIHALPKKVIVWGAGALTRRILEVTSLQSKTILFVDKNKGMQGTVLEGIPIVSPDELPQRNEPIFISSYTFRDEIIKEIQNRGLKNTVYTFS